MEQFLAVNAIIDSKKDLLLSLYECIIYIRSIFTGAYMSLELAPDHVKLAVDLIELLESNDIEPQVAVDALTIVLRDFKGKIASKDGSLTATRVVDQQNQK